jgi:hypothetical protein
MVHFSITNTFQTKKIRNKHSPKTYNIDALLRPLTQRGALNY